MLAVIGLLARVQPQVGFQISLFEERLSAAGVGALEFALAGVLVHVDLQALDARVAFCAGRVSALIHTLVHMRILVITQVALAHKSLAAAGVVARKGLDIRLLRLEE